MAIQDRASKRLFILGATGGIGRALIDQALARGHSVTAFVRSPEKGGGARDRLMVRSTLLRNIVEDTSEMERIVRESGLDFTIVRPPRLTNGRLTERYAIADENMPRGGSTVSRADVAHFLLEELERGGHLRRMVGMASGRPATAALMEARPW